MKLQYDLISANDHVQEHPEVWTSRMSKERWGDSIPHIEEQPDGTECWVVEGRPIPHLGVSAAGAPLADRMQPPKRWEDVPRMTYAPAERLKAMDLDGVAYSVLYPIVSGLAGEIFGKLDDPELELACVQAYNDWIIEEWASTSRRFIPQCIVPVWPIERTVSEIKRAVAKGHKGVVFPASPMELRDIPHINEPVYDPIWATLEEMGVPLCFHAGASPRIQLPPSETFSPSRAMAFKGIVRSVSSIAVVANFLLSRILERFPNLKVVFAESSLGWAAYELEYADYQTNADGLQLEGYSLKPSELFHRQCYLTCWYDRMSLQVRNYVGIKNILWSTKFPLTTSTWPHTGEDIDWRFAGLPAEETRQILWENAAKLYAI